MSRGELKSMLVRHLIDNHLVSEGDIIKHSYSNQRMMAPRIENQSNPDIFPHFNHQNRLLWYCC